jgi:anti-anti-sigma factor
MKPISLVLKAAASAAVLFAFTVAADAAEKARVALGDVVSVETLAFAVAMERAKDRGVDYEIEDAALSDGTPVLILRGELDLLACPTLKERLRALIDPGPTFAVVDLSEASFVDSTVLGALIGANRHLLGNDGALALVCDNPNIRTILTLPNMRRFDAPADRVREPVVLVPRFRPPAVRNAEVERAIGGGLHAAGATGFVRFARQVEPHIGAAHEKMGERDVVFLHQQKLLAHIVIDTELIDLPQQFLARLVLGVCLAGEDELHPVIAQQRRQPLRLTQ